MALAPAAAAPSGTGADAPADLRYFVFALFFIFGGITSLNDVIIPKLKELFTLTYFESMLVQSAFFAAYFFISLPGAMIVRRFGYMRTAAIGLVTMTAGCLLFIPAASSATFGLFLFALFVLASGVTIVQVVANPLISMLGAPATAHSRLTFAQAFNSLGTTVFPYFGAIIILGSLASVSAASLSGADLDAYRVQSSQVIVHTYLGLALALVVVAAVVWSRRNRLVEAPAPPASILRSFDLLHRTRFGLGALCIFLYVGGEVAIGSIIVSYLAEARVWGIAAADAGRYVPLYWGGALVGRFIGAAVLRVVSPGKVLAAVAAGVLILLSISANTTGAMAGWSLLAIGLCNSIMFPTIFSLASEGLGRRAAEGSGLICIAIVGGAIVPPLLGTVADNAGLAAALAVPAVCYAAILAYGLYAQRAVADIDGLSDERATELTDGTISPASRNA